MICNKVLKSILISACISFFVVLLSGYKKQQQYDICIYGGSSAGVIAAYSAKMMGKKVLLIEPSNRLGGLSSGGLGFTDIGNKQVVTGLAKDFYRRIGQHYGRFEQWIFEPKVAESIFKDYIKRANVEVLYNYRIVSATKENGYIKEILLENAVNTNSNKVIKASMFIDCSYEGDLMAKAGVSYIVGRESNATYNEIYNGVQLMKGHQFLDGVDPYRIKGDAASGLLWGITNDTLMPTGTADNKLQAYNYRICLTDDPKNRREIVKPDNYDASKYDLLLRLFEAQSQKTSLRDYFIWSKMPNQKTDINNKGGFSTDMIGANYNYPEASYAERDQIIKAHKEYTQGLLYFYKTDDRVPKKFREEIKEWGYPLDEYTDTDNWSPQLYVREARRMIGDYVMTQAHCENKDIVNDGIAMAAYTMDSHNTQRIVVQKDGKYMVKNEGNVEIGGGLPYPISYRSIIPKSNECKNLLVAICMSASHIAYGSIRMEPVFMVLGQSAAVAASYALTTGSVQNVDVAKIQQKLMEDPYLDGSRADILIDDHTIYNAKDTSGWKIFKKKGGYGTTFYIAEADNKDRPFLYPLQIPQKGNYTLYVYHHRQKDVDNTIVYEIFDGVAKKVVEIKSNEISIQGQTSGDWVKLGTFKLGEGKNAYVKLMPQVIQGNAIADAILLVSNR